MDNSNNEHKLFSLNKFRKIKENCYNKKLNCEQTAKKYIQTNPPYKLHKTFFQICFQKIHLRYSIYCYLVLQDQEKQRVRHG